MMKSKKIIAAFLSLLITFSFSFDAFAMSQVRLGQATISHIEEHFHNEYAMSIHALTQDISDLNGTYLDFARYLGPNTIIKLPSTRVEYEETSRQINSQKDAKMAEIRNSMTAQKNQIIAEMDANVEREKNRIKQDIRDSINSQKNNVIMQNQEALKREEDKNIQEIRRREQSSLREIEEQKNKRLAERK